MPLAALLVALSMPAVAATPCDAPERFVRAPKALSAVSGVASPLVHPYRIGGLPALSLREEGDARWLELAVHSAVEARRLLAGRIEPDAIVAHDARVWLRCPADAARI